MIALSFWAFSGVFLLFPKNPQKRILGWELENNFEIRWCFVKMTGSGNWIFEIRWGLPIFGEVYHTMRFYDKRWGFDHTMRFMIRWCFRFSVRFTVEKWLKPHRKSVNLIGDRKTSSILWKTSPWSNLTENRKHHRIINLIGWSKPHRLS